MVKNSWGLSGKYKGIWYASKARDNWTEGEKYLQNANGPGNVWENNGPKVDNDVHERAGLEAGYKDLLNIQ